jgi:hypothetical protein
VGLAASSFTKMLCAGHLQFSEIVIASILKAVTLLLVLGIFVSIQFLIVATSVSCLLSCWLL